MNYKTKNRDKLLNFLEDNKDKHLTIQEIKASLKDQIPQATIYRLITSFEQAGIVRKYSIDPTQASCYQYVGDAHHEHFHLVCEKCGKIIHLECGEVDKLLSHINEDHGFKTDISKVNLYGLCDECQRDKK